MSKSPVLTYKQMLKIQRHAARSLDRVRKAFGPDATKLAVLTFPAPPGKQGGQQP